MSRFEPLARYLSKTSSLAKDDFEVSFCDGTKKKRETFSPMKVYFQFYKSIAGY